MKRLLFLPLFSILLFTANTIFAQDMKAQQVSATSDTKITMVMPEAFQEYAAGNVGGKVDIKGMVVHVCKHGGKKMFIIGDDPDKRVKITASDKVSVFEPELEGSVVNVIGFIEPIEEEAVPEEEKASQDADHTNYYHVPQYAISCMAVRVMEE